MLIDCPSCQRSYHIARISVDRRGRRIHCTGCGTYFVVGPLLPDVSERQLSAGGFAMATAGAIPPPPATDAGWHTPAISAPWRPQGRISAVTVSTRTQPEAARRRGRPLRPLWQAGMALAGLGLAMGLIKARDEVVRRVPGAGAAYAMIGLPVNLRGLELQRVHSTLLADGGGSVLAVEGEIVNDRDRQLPVPDMRLSVRSAQGQELYSWTAQAPKAKLDAGETIAFRARLVAPPANGQAVMVRFADAEAAPGAGSLVSSPQVR
jgi:predicted Zn finger-like uncharacterized protein